MAERGAWRLDGGGRRVETIAPSSPPPVLLGCRPTSPCNVGDAGGIEPACTDAPDGARPRGERKDALDTVACRAQVVASIAAAAAAAVGVKPQAEAPHSAPVAPRGALRRRLRRRTCTARARALSACRFVLRARAGPTWESERSSSVARARPPSRRAAKKRAGRWQMERWLVSSAVLRCAWSRAQRVGGAHARSAKKVGRTKKLFYWCSQPGPQKGVSPTFLWGLQVP
jgi:hypothetical protein